MKKVGNYVVFTLIIFMFVLIIPKADSCTYKEQAALNKEASNIKFNYEVVDKTDEIKNLPEDAEYKLEDYKYIDILVTNLSESMYIEVKNNIDDKIVTYHYSDQQEGVIRFKKNYDEVIKYTFNIYAATANCKNRLQTKNLTVPKFNRFAQLGACKEIPDYKYCKELITTTISDSKISQSIANEYREKIYPSSESKESKTSILDYIKIGVIFLGIIIVVGSLVLIIYWIIRKKRIV